MPQGWTAGPAPETGWTPGPAPTERPPDFKTTNEPPSASMQQEAADPNTVATYARHIWQTLNPVQLGQMLPFPKAAGGSGMDNPLLPANILANMRAVKQEADERWAKGDKVGAAAKYTESLIPILGPMMSHAGNQAQRGEWAALAGDVTGAVAVPELARRLPTVSARVTPPLVQSHLNPTEAAAIRFGQAQRVPLDVATQTGSKWARAAEKRVASSMGGEGTASDLITRQANALTRVGEAQAGKALPTAVTTEQAGVELAAALEAKVQAHQDLANHAYDALRTIETDPAHLRQVRLATPDTAGRLATVQMPLPIDLRLAKRTLTPIYQQLERQYPLTRQQSSSGFKALQNIVQGPDYAPLSQVDRDLSALKEIARSEGGVTKLAVKEVDAAVRKRAAQAGPNVIRTLEQGRGAVKARVATSELLEGMRSEPVKAYRQMVAPQDSGIALLRTMNQEVPHAIPGVARAYLDSLMNMATAEGGFARAARLQAEWQKLGSETKRILFPRAGQVQALDNFFLLAKRIAENPNPSGTAHTLTALNLTSQPIMFGLAKMLYTPGGVRALTRGLTLSLDPSKLTPTMQAAAAANIMKAAQEAGVNVSPQQTQQP